MLNRAIESNYDEVLKNFVIDENADFPNDLTLDCLKKSLNVRERELASIVLKIIKDTRELFSTSLIPVAEQKGLHKIVIHFDYSDFEAEQKINVGVGLMPMTTLFDELLQNESPFVLDKEFQIYISKNPYSFASKRIEKGRALLMDMCYKDFKGFLGLLLDNHIFTQINLNISVVEDFLKENWYPFLDTDSKVKRFEYLYKITQMVAKYGWVMPQDIEWEIEKSMLFVDLLQTEYIYKHRTEDIERWNTGIPLRVFFEDFDFRIPSEDQIPACALSLYFFAEIFGTNIEKSSRLNWDDGQNYIEHRSVFDENGAETKIYGNGFIDATSFKPTGFCEEMYALDLPNLSHKKLDMNVVEDIFKDESLDFDSFFGESLLTRATFGGQVMAEIGLDLDKKQDEYALIVSYLGK